MSSYYQVLNHSAISHCPADFIWKSKVPSKVAIFLWVLYHGKTPTLDLLQHRGTPLGNRCYLCSQDEESCNHIFLHCSFAFKVWDRSVYRSSKSWVLPSSTQALIWEWSQDSGDGLSRGKELWRWLPFSVC